MSHGHCPVDAGPSHTLKHQLQTLHLTAQPRRSKSAGPFRVDRNSSLHLCSALVQSESKAEPAIASTHQSSPCSLTLYSLLSQLRLPVLWSPVRQVLVKRRLSTSTDRKSSTRADGLMSLLLVTHHALLRRATTREQTMSRLSLLLPVCFT